MEVEIPDKWKRRGRTKQVDVKNRMGTMFVPIKTGGKMTKEMVEESFYNNSK